MKCNAVVAHETGGLMAIFFIGRFMKINAGHPLKQPLRSLHHEQTKYRKTAQIPGATSGTA